MAVLAGKLAARRAECAPAAGKSTLNRLELSKLAQTRYHKISHNPVAIKALLVDLFLEAHERPPRRIILDLDATDDPLHGEQEGRFFHGYYDCYCYLPLYVFCGRHLLARQAAARGHGRGGRRGRGGGAHRGGRGAIRIEVELALLDPVLHLAASAVDLLVEILGLALVAPELTTKRGLASPFVHSALATTRRRDQDRA